MSEHITMGRRGKIESVSRRGLIIPVNQVRDLGGWLDPQHAQSLAEELVVGEAIWASGTVAVIRTKLGCAEVCII